MGPSRYLMPDLFEKFFKEIGEDINDHLDLAKLSPSYKVFYPEDEKLESMNIYADIDRMADQFEQMEVGAGDKFRSFLKTSGQQYGIGMDFALRNYDSLLDFLSLDVAIK